MKNLVFFLVVSVLGLWVIEGKLMTETPSVNNEEETTISRPFCNETASEREDKPVTEGPTVNNETENATLKSISTVRRRKIRTPCVGCCDVPGGCEECTWNPCGKYGRCIITPGSYKCICEPGFRFDRRTCVDINECHVTYCGRNARCYNTLGSYYCKCYKSGFEMIGNRCVDINECLRNPCPYGITCHNFPGSYRCACRRGYVFKNNRCVDIDECRNNNGGCPFPYRCVNVPGFHYCDCPYGFRLKGNMCRLMVPRNKLNFTIAGNPTAIPNLKQQVLS